MKDHFFYNSFRRTIIQFLDLFNDIKIAKFDHSTGEVLRYVKVPLKFAPKTKQWYYKEQRESNETLDKIYPMMAVNLESIQFAQDRVVNKNKKISVTRTGSGSSSFLNPTPFDFIFTLQIASQYMVDVTQIIEQVLPFFSPEAYIRLTIPELGIEDQDDVANSQEHGTHPIDIRVVFEDATPDSPVDIGEEEYRTILWTLNFRVQGYMFSPVQNTELVHKVVQKYYTETETFETYGTNTETEDIRGVGHQTLEGLTSATYEPAPDEEISDDIKEMFKYEVFE